MCANASIGEAPYWIVVADGSKAIVYAQATRRSSLHELASFENAAARMRTDTMISDRGGRSFDSHGQGRHTYTSEKSGPKEQSAKAFARQVAEHIANARHRGTCRDFALIAAPRFLGYLRDALSAVPNGVPLITIDKAVVGQDREVIAKLLAESWV